MTMLFDEHPIVVSPALASCIGLNEAIVIQQIHYWSQKSKHLIDGHTWIYNSVRSWREQFPFWSEATIKRTLDRLEDMGLIVSGRHNKHKRDQTKWYRINYQSIADLSQSRFGQNDQMEQVKMTKSTRSKCANAVGQNDQTITRDYTETTTDTVNTLAADAPRVPYQEFVSLYHECLPELPRVQLLTEKRKKAIKARWNTSEKTKSLDWWREYFLVCKSNPFLMGDNSRGWRADFDFLMTESKFARIVEGSYNYGVATG